MLVGPLLALGAFCALLAYGAWNRRAYYRTWQGRLAQTLSQNRLLVLSDSMTISVYASPYVPEGQVILMNKPGVKPPFFDFADCSVTPNTTGSANIGLNLSWKYFNPPLFSPQDAFKITNITAS